MNFTDYFTKPEVGGVKLQIVEAGKLTITSGKIVACDPCVPGDPDPFTRTVKPGSYPVTLCRVNLEGWGPRFALARISFTATSPLKWVTAVTAKACAAYPVISGTGCFMDYDTAILYEKITAGYEKRRGRIYFSDVIMPELEDTGWVNHLLQKGKPDNIILCNSGVGDGAYPSYWGLDSQGKIACLVTDFQVLAGGK